MREPEEVWLPGERDRFGLRLSEGDTVLYDYRKWWVVSVNGTLHLYNGKRKQMRPLSDFEPEDLERVNV